ncbi:MAG TPA: Wzz/FepE/Etk N-terminal domain-containing protein [Gaiellaceae bacterium]|nr:Wzz/FepE/Etk N-terminal domain-containing protein [Gaiellaceae bacterium]
MRRFATNSRLALVLVVCTAAGAAAAAGYGLTAPKRYRATAQVLVSPISPSDPTFAGLGVLRDTGGKRTAAADVAALLRGPQLADAVAASLGLRRSRSSLEHALHVSVVDSSDVVDVSAEDSTRTGAAELANSFASALISQRSASFQSQLSNAIRRDQKLVAQGADAAVARRLTTLKGFVGQPDPTVRVASEAASPGSSSWPNLPRLIGIGAAIGAAAGAVVALVLLALRGAGRVRPGEYDPAVSEAALEKLVDRLEARLLARESALAARERDVQAKLDELRQAAAAAPAKPDDSGLRGREEALEKRVEAVTKREAEMARHAAELAVRERKLAEDEAAAAERAAVAAAVPEPVPIPTNGAAGTYSLTDLEQLVANHGGEHPEKVEEWQSYLFFLRDYVRSDGRIPASFDGLITETFSDLL